MPRPDWRMALLILNTGVVVHVDLGEIHGHLPSLRLRRRGELASSLNQDPLRLGAHRVALSKSPAPRVLSESLGAILWEHEPMRSVGRLP
mmetsp:Transcript_20434/g.40190  ORF Transcript_20434/g.40190 Transcript_20434/m.40190 type:complete len:90 (-) Transcript_20434:530-799(-)